MIKKINALFLILFLVSASAAFAISDKQNLFANEDSLRVIYKFDGKIDPSVITREGGKVINDNILDKYLVAQVSKDAVKKIARNKKIAGYEIDSEIEFFEIGNMPSLEVDNLMQKVNVVESADPVDQPPQTLPWNIDRIDADQTSATGLGIKICIPDTGIAKFHPDLHDNILTGRNFVDFMGNVNPNRWGDGNGHGTHIAGIAAALDNSIGVVGVAPETSLIIARVADNQGVGYGSIAAAGIEYCTNQGADIISMSFGSTDGGSEVLRSAIKYAHSHDILLVAAAGNDAGAVRYPASDKYVIAVSSTIYGDGFSSSSNRGPKIEISAPGSGIYSTTTYDGYEWKSGTSMAAPHVAGVAALAMQTHPSFNSVQIRQLLRDTADDLGAPGKDDYFGYGLIDAELI